MDPKGRWLWIVGFTWLAGAAPVAGAVESDPFTPLEARGTRPVEPAPSLEAPPLVLQDATVMTATGVTFQPGHVVVNGGRITAVGPGAAPSIPGATVLDLGGRVLTPGLIDTHSHLGVYPAPSAKAHADGNEATSPVTAGVWAEHSVWPQDPGFDLALAGGVTTMMVLPGSANLVGGRGVVIQNVPARGSRAMRFPGAPEQLKMACGENPKRVYEKSGPSTRMGNLEGQRTAFLRAESYRARWRAWAEKDAAARERLAAWEEENGARVAAGKAPKSPRPEPPPDPPDRDLELETLVGVLEGRVLPQVHCYRADDMVSFLQVADEFGFRVRSFHHALEAYKVRDLLAAREVSVSTWADWWGFKMEAYDGVPYNLGFVHQAGARAVVHSDSAVGIQRLNQEAAKGWRAAREAGIALAPDDVLRWITANPAWSLGILEQTGTIEVGKRGDLVVWSRDPFSVYARADLVFIQGALVWDASRPRERSDFEIGQREVVP